MNRPKHLSLIKIRLLIDSNVCSAIVDSGCNVSCISDSLVKDLNLRQFPLNEIVNYKTADNVIQCLGRVKCNVPWIQNFHSATLCGKFTKLFIYS